MSPVTTVEGRQKDSLTSTWSFITFVHLYESSKQLFKKWILGDLPGGPVAKSVLPMLEAQVWSLVREQDSTRCN